MLHAVFVNRVAAGDEKKDFPNHTTRTVHKQKIVTHLNLDLFATTKFLTALVLAFVATSLNRAGPCLLWALKQLLSIWINSICDGAMPPCHGKAPTGASTIAYVASVVVSVVVAHGVVGAGVGCSMFCMTSAPCAKGIPQTSSQSASSCVQPQWYSTFTAPSSVDSSLCLIKMTSFI